MGFFKNAGRFHTDARQGGDSEEAPVVQLGVGPPPAHQLVVLAVMDVLRGVPGRIRAGGQREPVVVVPQLAVHDFQLVQVIVRAQHGQAHLAPGEVPFDVERVRVRRVLAFLQQGPPPGVLRGRGYAHMVRHNVHQDTHAVLAGGCREGQEPFRAAAFGVDGGRVGHVIAVVRALFRRQDR